MIGDRILIKKLWAKFDHMDVVCFFEEHDRRCKGDKECKEYVVKFTEVKREPVDIKVKTLGDSLIKDEKLLKKATKELQKQTNELKKSINKFKIK